jgi:hypothetical protein
MIRTSFSYFMSHDGDQWHLCDVFPSKITEINFKCKQDAFYSFKYKYPWIFSWLTKFCNKIWS